MPGTERFQSSRYDFLLEEPFTFAVIGKFQQLFNTAAFMIKYGFAKFIIIHSFTPAIIISVDKIAYFLFFFNKIR